MLNAERLRLAAPAAAAARHPVAAPPRAREVGHVLMTADAVGGVWQYAVGLGRSLASRGVRTTLAVMGPTPHDDQRREAERTGLAVIDRPYRLEWMDEPWEDVQRAGDWLLSLDRTLRPDVVHLNGYAHAALPWSPPVVVVAHSCVRSWWRAVKLQEPPARCEPYRRAVSAGLAAARLVVAPTAAMLRAVETEYAISLPRSRVIPNACVPLGEPDWRTKDDLILSAGRVWDEAKNIRALCEVAGRLPWPVYVAGDTCSPDGRTCDTAGARSLGRVSAGELAGWYRRASIYVLPARYEPFGLSVLEAASGGCALVLGDIPSLRENWTDAALFVPPDDAAALTSAIRTLIADRQLRRELGHRAWSRAGRFSTERTVDDYLRAYQDLV